MRSDNATFEAINLSRSKEPRYVIEVAFDTANTDLHYFTSHADCLLPVGASSTLSVIEKISGTTQKIIPDEGRAEIGTISFSLVDKSEAVSTLIRTKEAAGYGLRHKRVRVYLGYKDDTITSFADHYMLVQTQIIDGLSYQNGAYEFKCADIQRSTRQDIFDLVETNITATVPLPVSSTLAAAATASDGTLTLVSTTDFQTSGTVLIGSEEITYTGKTTTTLTGCTRGANGTAAAAHAVDDAVTETRITVNVVATAEFEMLAHGASYTDAPSATVGYFKIDDEIFRYTGTTATSFTGCVRGVLGTKPAAHEVSSGVGSDRQPKVTEYVYLEMPAVKLALAILTGDLYGQTGETLPSGWHLGISADYVNTAEFTACGTDWWDTSDDTKGVVFQFAGLERTDAKRFIEKEILFPLSAFMPVRATGALGFKRRAAVAANAPYLVTLNESNIASHGPLVHAMSSLANIYKIKWNWVDSLERFTRENVLSDLDSVSVHQIGASKTLEFRGLHGRWFTDSLIRQRFQALRDAYANPPETIDTTLAPSLNALEVGDVVRLNLENVRDAATTGGSTIDRTFEVQRVAIDWITGQAKVSLFGSTGTASPINFGETLPAAFYTEGTDLSTVLSLDASGNLLVDATITGGADMNAAIFHLNGPLTVPFGKTLTVAGNVQLRIADHFQVDGMLTGAGQGRAGATAYDYRGVDGYTVPPAAATGGILLGGASGGGVNVDVEAGSWGEISSKFGGQPRGGTLTGSIGSYVLVEGLPPLEIRYDGSSLLGIPADLRGTPGAQGGNVYSYEGSSPLTLRALGGNGGSSGAGLVVVCKSASKGASGIIDLSGVNGSSGATYTNGDDVFYAGTGGGGTPGCFLLVIDGGSSVFPLNSEILLEDGCPALPAGVSVLSKAYEIYRTALSGNLYGYYTQSRDHITPTRVSRSDAAYRVVHIVGEQVPEEDVPTTTSDPTAVHASVVNNVPPSPKGDLCTIEAYADDPTDGNHAYNNIYIRASGQTGWMLMGPDTPEATIIVDADGTTYELQARSVSISNVESPSGPTTTVTVPNLTAPVVVTDDAPEDVLVVPNVTGLELYEQGNDTEFVGRDAKFAWREVTISDFFEMGEEPTGTGAGTGALDSYFRDYWVCVYDGSLNLLREEFVVDPFYIYTLEKNIEDYQRLNAARGANRSFTVTVVVRCWHTTAVSDRPAKLTVSNPAPALGTAVSISALTSSIQFKATKPTDHDLSGLCIWVDTATGFTKSATNLMYDGDPSAAVSIAGLKGGTAYYVQYAYRDAFADADAYQDGTGLTVSSEYTVTTTKADAATEIANLSNWATRLSPADLTFIEENLGADSIPSTRIESIVAGKIAAGTLASRVAVSGVFSATGTSSALNESGLTAGTWRLDMGPVTDGGITYIQRYHDGNGNKKFWIDEAGSAGFSGFINASAFYTSGSYLTAAPSLGATTLYVHDTSSFASSGSGYILDTTGVDTVAGHDAFSWTGKTATTLTGCSSVEAHNAGAIVVSTRALVIHDDANQFYVYGDRGDGTVDQLASIGLYQYGSDLIIGRFGNLSSTAVGVYGASDSHYGIWGVSNDSIGVRGASSTSAGVLGQSTIGKGVYGLSTSDIGVYGESVNNNGAWFVGTGKYAARLTGGLLLDEQSSSPPVTPSANAAAAVYVKADKLIVSYDDAGTMKYRYLTLTSTDATWTYTTTAP